VREIDRQFERNTNCELDNGVLNMQKSSEAEMGCGKANNNQFDPFDGVDKIDERVIVEFPKGPQMAKRKCKVEITESRSLAIGIVVSRSDDAMHFGELWISS
jgi:hypothetical protein